MWPFKRKPPPTRYTPIDYQAGDKVVCVNDSPHTGTHQALLSVGHVYEVRDVRTDLIVDGFGGPFAQLVGVIPARDLPWAGRRFRKVLSVTKKQNITEQVMQAAFTPAEVVRERAEAGEVWG